MMQYLPSYQESRRPLPRLMENPLEMLANQVIPSLNGLSKMEVLVSHLNRYHEQGAWYQGPL